MVPGTDPGAPAVPNLRAKLVWTTVVATIVFALAALAHAYRLVTLDQLGTLFGPAAVIQGPAKSRDGGDAPPNLWPSDNSCPRIGLR